MRSNNSQAKERCNKSNKKKFDERKYKNVASLKSTSSKCLSLLTIAYEYVDVSATIARFTFYIQMRMLLV